MLSVCLNQVRLITHHVVAIQIEDETDGTERQVIKDMDGNIPRARIKVCGICDPFVLILREDETIGLFIGEPERGKVRRKDMSPMGEKVRGHDTLAHVSVETDDISADLPLPRGVFLHGFRQHVRVNYDRRDSYGRKWWRQKFDYDTAVCGQHWQP